MTRSNYSPASIRWQCAAVALPSLCVMLALSSQGEAQVDCALQCSTGKNLCWRFYDDKGDLSKVINCKLGDNTMPVPVCWPSATSAKVFSAKVDVNQLCLTDEITVKLS